MPASIWAEIWTHSTYIFGAHPERYSKTKDFNRNSCGWWWVGEIQSKSANLKSHKYIHSEENTFICNCINILPLQLFALTSPCSCKRNPTIARNATYLSFHLYILHHTCLYIVGASLVRFPDPHYIVNRGT